MLCVILWRHSNLKLTGRILLWQTTQMEKQKAFIKLIRPKTLVWFCIATCFGFASVIQHNIPTLNFLWLVLTIVFANIGAIIVNDIGDIEVDSKSEEHSKRTRPLVTGVITVREGIILACIFYTLSLLTSFAYDIRATIFSGTVIIFSLSYSLPPTKFCARPYGSILYWIVLCMTCYLLMLNALTMPNKDLNFYFHYSAGWVFIAGIILFMGIAEIIAKDLRDLINDREGGRNTFVNFVGVETSCRVMLFFSWFGFILWTEALYLSGTFPTTFAGLLCFVIGFYWCIRTILIALKLSTEFNQPLAATLHQHWTYTYATMQLLTFLSFIKK